MKCVIKKIRKFKFKTQDHEYKSKIDKLYPSDSKYQIKEILGLIFGPGKFRRELDEELDNNVSHAHHK